MYHKVGAALAKQAADKAAAATKAYNAQSTRMMAEAQMNTSLANIAKAKGKSFAKIIPDGPTMTIIFKDGTEQKTAIPAGASKAEIAIMTSIMEKHLDIYGMSNPKDIPSDIAKGKRVIRGILGGVGRRWVFNPETQVFK
jgi:hypothetical protein